MEYVGAGCNLVELCRDAINWQWEIRFEHVPRDQNRVVDLMAFHAQKQDGEFLFLNEATGHLQMHLRENELGLFGNNNTVRTS